MNFPCSRAVAALRCDSRMLASEETSTVLRWYDWTSSGTGRYVFVVAERPGERYIVTAWGRDFRDVSPLKGVIYTEAKKSELTVKVDVFRVNPDGTLS